MKLLKQKYVEKRVGEGHDQQYSPPPPPERGSGGEVRGGKGAGGRDAQDRPSTGGEGAPTPIPHTLSFVLMSTSVYPRD